MRLPQANKATMPTVPTSADFATSTEKNVRETCHHCGRTVSDRSCRQETAGWFCWQYGLILGDGVELFGPEPEPSPWKDDPTVIAAAQGETAAQEEYDAANVAWETAVRKLAEQKILTTFDPRQGWNNPDNKKDTRGRDKQMKAEVAARQQRDNAGAALAKARVAYQRALNSCAECQGGPYSAEELYRQAVVQGNTTGTRSPVIPPTCTTQWPRHGEQGRAGKAWHVAGSA